jgi:hypothetical protein
MRLDLDTPIRFVTGDAAGVLRRVIVGPNSDVTDVVMATSDLVSRNVIVPASALEDAPGDVLQINLTPDQVDQLPDYEQERVPAVPDGWQFPTDAAPGDDVFPATLLQPIIPVVEVSNVSEDELVISQGTEIACLDGRWGVVDEVLTDDSGRVTSLIARSDAVDEHDHVIPVSLVVQADANQVVLNCTLADLSTYTEEIVDEGAEPEL